MALALFAASLEAAVVVRPVANLYAGPALDTDVVSQAIYGASVAVLEQRPGWAKVRTPDQYTGWAQQDALLEAQHPYAASGDVVEVENLFANIYREPDVTKHAPLLTVPFETRLEVAARPADQERWLQIRLPGGAAAWIQRGDAAPIPPKLNIAQTVEFSRRFVGLPYLWGGVSTFGYDCSGLVQMLYRRMGIILPRDAGPQAAWEGLAPVDSKDLRPGDLLYFGASPHKITHTGMYLGGGQFINATTWIRPIVQIVDLRDPHWTRLLVACRRLK